MLLFYGNGGDLSFMLIIGIACTEFVMISFCFRSNIPTQKRVKNIKCCSRSHYISHLWCWNVSWFCCGLLIIIKCGTTNWQMVWIIPAGIAFLVFLLFALLFDSKKENQSYLIR
jgi:hypothetical protein